MADQRIDESLVITTQDLRTCGFCAKGTRPFFLDRAVDWRRFVTEGLPWSEFKVRDELENALYRAALERVKGNGECEEHAAFSGNEDTGAAGRD